MVTELRKNVTSIRFCDSDSDGADALIYLSVGSKEYGVHNLKNHLKGLKEGSSVYLKVFECSLNDYDVLMDTYGSENVQHMLPSTFEIKCQKEGLLDLEEGGGLR
jgi:hypothetical protein